MDAIGNGSGDLSRLDALCAADMVNHALAPGRPQGIEGTRQFLAAARRSEHPGRWTESIVVAEGEMVVQFGQRDCTGPAARSAGSTCPPGSAPATSRSPTACATRASPNGGPSVTISPCSATGRHDPVTGPDLRRGDAATSRRPRRGQAAPPRAPYGYVVVDGGPYPNPRKAAEGYRLRLLALDDVGPVR